MKRRTKIKKEHLPKFSENAAKSGITRTYARAINILKYIFIFRERTRERRERREKLGQGERSTGKIGERKRG